MPADPALAGEAGGDPPAGEMPAEGANGPEAAAGAGGTQKEVEEYEPGSPKYALQQTVLKMQAGTTKCLDEVIAAGIKDEILVPLRDGTASPAQIKKAQELVAKVDLAGKRESGITKIFYLRNSAGKVLTFTTRRDPKSGDYMVVGLEVETPDRVRRRNTYEKRRQQRGQGGY